MKGNKNENLSSELAVERKDVKKAKGLFEIFMHQKVVKNYHCCRMFLLKNLFCFT